MNKTLGTLNEYIQTFITNCNISILMCTFHLYLIMNNFLFELKPFIGNQVKYKICCPDSSETTLCYLQRWQQTSPMELRQQCKSALKSAKITIVFGQATICFTESVHWADSVQQSRCLLSVCLSVPFPCDFFKVLKSKCIIWNVYIYQY